MEFLTYTERNDKRWRDVLSAEDRMRSIVGSTVNPTLLLTFLEVGKSTSSPWHDPQLCKSDHCGCAAVQDLALLL